MFKLPLNLILICIVFGAILKPDFLLRADIMRDLQHFFENFISHNINNVSDFIVSLLNDIKHQLPLPNL